MNPSRNLQRPRGQGQCADWLTGLYSSHKPHPHLPRGKYPGANPQFPKVTFSVPFDLVATLVVENQFQFSSDLSFQIRPCLHGCHVLPGGLPVTLAIWGTLTFCLSGDVIEGVREREPEALAL